MEQYLHNAYSSYFNSLRKLGYVKDNNVKSLLIITFIYRLIFFDYRGIICERDYHTIEKAINCLYGTSCLLPYRDYLKMGKLHIGEYTELAHRLCNLELIDDSIEDRATALEGRAEILEERADNAEERLDVIESTRVAKSERDVIEVDDIQL